MSKFHIIATASPLKQRGAILGVEYVLWFSVSLILSMVLVQVFSQTVANLTSLLSDALRNEGRSLGQGVNSATQQICFSALNNGNTGNVDHIATKSAQVSSINNFNGPCSPFFGGNFGNNGGLAGL